MGMNDQITQLVLENIDTGTLCKEICSRMEKGVQIRIHQKGVRVTHSAYIDKLQSPQEINAALARNELGRFLQACS